MPIVPQEPGADRGRQGQHDVDGLKLGTRLRSRQEARPEVQAIVYFLAQEHEEEDHGVHVELQRGQILQ